MFRVYFFKIYIFKLFYIFSPSKNTRQKSMILAGDRGVNVHNARRAYPQMYRIFFIFPKILPLKISHLFCPHKTRGNSNLGIGNPGLQFSAKKC